MSNFWDKIQYFDSHEFECKCGCGLCRMDYDFVLTLDKIRGEIKMPMRVNSGMRCRTHNDAIGGSTVSAHLKGYAADIHVSSSHFRFKLIESALKHGITRIGATYKDFVHLDVDSNIDKPSEVMW